MGNDQSLRSSLIGKLLLVVGVIAFVYHMVSPIRILQGPVEHQIVHLAMALTIVFLDALRRKDGWGKRIAWLACLAVGLACTIYMRLDYDRLEDIIGFPETRDMVVGVALLAVILVGTWMSWGAVFPSLMIILIAYFFWGHLLPNPLYHPEIEPDLAISYLDIGLTGVFGPLLSVMANFALLLLVFGTLLEFGGANEFFLEVGKAAGRFMAGGPGQTAVIGSSMVGMVSGGAVQNVLITGTFTIPMMKKVGYRPEVAGGIEATASTGSQLMPPIMGIAAFLMAGFLGVDFAEIMIAGVIPALLFYAAVAVSVQIIAKKDRIEAEEVPFDRSVVIRLGPLFVIPLAGLITLLLLRFSASMASVFVITGTIILLYLLPSSRKPLPDLLEAITKGVVIAAKVSMALAAVGVLSQVFITTGLAQKLALLVRMISFGHLSLVLFFTMILALILGLGLPASAAYSLVAILIAPGIIQMGVEPIRAHFFAFYFAIISAVTPPVALGAMAATSIAKSKYMQTGIQAFKLSISGFIIPFLIIFNPVFLLRPGASFLAGVVTLAATLAAIFLLTFCVYNFFRAELAKLEWVGMMLGALALFAFCFAMDWYWLIAGVVIGAISVGIHLSRTARLYQNGSA